MPAFFYGPSSTHRRAGPLQNGTSFKTGRDGNFCSFPDWGSPFSLPGVGLLTVCCRPDRTDMFIKDRRAAPALGLRSLQPYVSAALRPEQKRVRNGHICPVRHLSIAVSFLIPAEKKASVRKRTKAISLVLTTCYCILRRKRLPYGFP